MTDQMLRVTALLRRAGNVLISLADVVEEASEAVEEAASLLSEETA